MEDQSTFSAPSAADGLALKEDESDGSSSDEDILAGIKIV